MRELLRMLCQQLGVILPSGAFEFPVAEGEGEDSITYSDGLSFSYTDNGIEGPCWATLFAAPPNAAEGCQQQEDNAPAHEGEPAKPSEPGGETQTP
jgi:hypothetical protein